MKVIWKFIQRLHLDPKYGEDKTLSARRELTRC